MSIEAAGPIVAAVEPVTAAFAAAGRRLYLVGGIVRDVLSGRQVERQDIDLTTDARPEQVKQLVAPLATSVWTQGERFGTIGCVVDGQDLEITTHRAERYDGATRKPSVEFSGDVVADLSRRDFTVNAMAIEVTSESPQLIDPFDGAGDLGARVLRTPLDPEVSFTDDPLRMLRAARFVAGFALDPVPELGAAVRELGDRLEIVSRERVRDELEKLLATTDPSSGLDFLAATGLLSKVLEQVASRSDLPDRGGCHPDDLTHTIALVGATAPGTPARRAAFFAGAGALEPGVGELTATATTSAMRHLRYSREATDAVRAVLEAAPLLGRLVHEPVAREGGAPDGVAPEGAGPGGPDDRRLRRFAAAARGARAEVLDLARSEALLRRRVDGGEAARRVDAVRGGLERLSSTEDLDELTPAATGDDVRRQLGIPPGPDVGAALAHLRERRLELGPRPLEDELADLQRWWTTRPHP